MRPLFTTQPVLLGVLVVSLILWRGMETILDVRSLPRFRAGARRQDRGSRLVVSILVVLGVLLGSLLAFSVPATAIPRARLPLFWLGILLIYGGMALRVYAVHTLGAYFTTSVAVAPEQTVIETGPYRLLRHPSYTGFLITLFGLALCLANWLSLLVMLGFAVAGFSYRIRVEERTLREQLGQRYDDYMRRTKRLLPYIL